MIFARLVFSQAKIKMHDGKRASLAKNSQSAPFLDLLALFGRGRIGNRFAINHKA